MSTTPSANSILMSGGGAFASFKEHGDTVTGTILDIGEPYHVREFNQATQRSDGPPKYTKAGKPVYAFHVTLSTDERKPGDPEDDGTRVVDVNSWRMQDAIRNAIRSAGGPGLEVGARLTVSYTHDEVPGDKRSGKHYSAEYVRGANAALMGGGPAPAAAAQPVAPVAQPVAPVAVPAPVAEATAPAAPAPQAENPATKAKGMAALGMTADQIAGAMGLDVGVVEYLLAS